MWWFQNTQHLPVSTGPFVPACQDLMLGYGKTSLLLRFFYPTNLEKHKEKKSEHWIPWLLDYDYFAGFSKVMTIPLYIFQLGFWWYGVDVRNPKSSVKTPVLYGQQPNTKNKLKCIVMSHGLGGCRFLYSKICYDLASYGFLVAILEHKDSSACHTYYYGNEELSKQDCKTKLDFEHKLLGETHYNERNKQILFRTEECSKVIDFLIELNKGNVPKNVLDDVPTSPKSSFKLDDLVGKLDLENLGIIGHSFGAASAMNTLAMRKDIKYGILLDPWMFPIKNEKLDEKIHQPLLFINTQTFHIVSNINTVSKFLTDDSRKMFTILHTTHENQTDTVLIFGNWMNWFMKKLNPLTAMKINQSLILKFLHDNINYPKDVSEEVKFLEKEQKNIEIGLTKPWA